MTISRAACLVPLLALVNCHGPSVGVRANESRPPVPVHAVPVRLYTPQSGERYSASLMPAQQITLAFREGGFVQTIHQVSEGESRRRLEAGDLIEKGTILATLRSRDYDLPLAQAQGQLQSAQNDEEAARAQLAQAEASSTKAASGWSRANVLYEARALTAPDWEASRAERDGAAAQVSAARSRLAAAMAQVRTAAAVVSSAELARSDTSLPAPFSGRVIQRLVEVGSLVSASQPVLTLADTSSLKAVFGVPDSSLIRVKPSQRIPLSVEAVPGSFSAVITSIAAAADAATRLFLVEATIPNPAGTLRPGLIATVNLLASTSAQRVPVVPLSAITRGKAEVDGFSVLVVRDGRVNSRLVTLGVTYGDLIAVSGVQPGELVVTAGASLLSEGEAVEVIQ